VQEEPENMGALRYMVRRLRAPDFARFQVDFLARHPAASPATGSHKIHEATQEALLKRAFQF
jgi:2-oxoglutarate dehydrogenase E1 component